MNSILLSATQAIRDFTIRPELDVSMSEDYYIIYSFLMELSPYECQLLTDRLL
ncbi:Unannotated [Lentimonas sp. CC19]|nr:Unannotated [Lentimonas sp. CC4]CAA6687011.1 Unannotated [Lentimonas sp. CC6]CAA6696745.1 Unannotated [Lentimonas sp. CC10]CAA6697309.1 Unannotated [Lentimonas sp. CC19]CAA7072266.1 Unannotated [Lentimonas sp. CC11]CAA7172020.1 Unannotated [Lentimonas sp. CC21]CAA7182917.1 Unannotated [Lentimonas sp. CC8]